MKVKLTPEVQITIPAPIRQKLTWSTNYNSCPHSPKTRTSRRRWNINSPRRKWSKIANY